MHAQIRHNNSTYALHPHPHAHTGHRSHRPAAPRQSASGQRRQRVADTTATPLRHLEAPWGTRYYYYCPGARRWTHQCRQSILPRCRPRGAWRRRRHTHQDDGQPKRYNKGIRRPTAGNTQIYTYTYSATPPAPAHARTRAHAHRQSASRRVADITASRCWEAPPPTISIEAPR